MGSVLSVAASSIVNSTTSFFLFIFELAVNNYGSVFFCLQHGLLTQLLRLAHNCLTFDFIGTSTDESSDDLCTVHCPTSWRPAFLDFSTLKLFFDLYHSLPTTLSPLVSGYLFVEATFGYKGKGRTN